MTTTTEYKKTEKQVHEKQQSKDFQHSETTHGLLIYSYHMIIIFVILLLLDRRKNIYFGSVLQHTAAPDDRYYSVSILRDYL